MYPQELRPPLLVDRKFLLFVGLKDDTKRTSYEAIGVSMFSSIRSTAISFVTIFEIIWRQQELYQQLSKFHQRIETYELINKQLNDTIGDLKHRLNFWQLSQVQYYIWIAGNLLVILNFVITR